MDSNDEQAERVNEVAHFEILETLSCSRSYLFRQQQLELRLKYHNHEVELKS
jgi:hypothetical protein